MNDDFHRLATVLSDWSPVSAGDIEPEMEIEAGLDIDSLSRLELVLAMNKEFRRTFDDEEVLSAKTVADLMCLLPTSR